MLRCLGWHDGKCPIAKWGGQYAHFRSCDECFFRFSLEDRFKDIRWHRITWKEHLRAAIATPFFRLDRVLYRVGFRWKQTDWLGLWGDRIYRGRWPFRGIHHATQN